MTNPTLKVSYETAESLQSKMRTNYTPPGEVGELESRGPGSYGFHVNAPSLFEDGEFKGEARVKRVVSRELKKREGIEAHINGTFEGDNTFYIQVSPLELPLEVGNIVEISPKSWGGWLARVTEITSETKVSVDAWKGKQRHSGPVYISRISKVYTDEELEEIEIPE